MSRTELRLQQGHNYGVPLGGGQGFVNATDDT